MHKKVFWFCFIQLCIMSSFIHAQKPDESFYKKKVNKFFNQQKPEKDQFEEFIDVFEVIYLDTTGLEPMPKENLDTINKIDKERGKIAEEWNKRGGFVQMPPKETKIRFMDKDLRNLSVNKYQHILTEKLHKNLGRKIKVTLQYYVHWTGKISGVKLIRYSKNSAVDKKEVVQALLALRFKKYQVFPERHFNIPVNSVNIIVLGFD